MKYSLIAAAALLAASGSTFAGTTVGSVGVSGPAPAMTDLGIDPPASALVMNAGLEWAWANPCSATPSGCGGGNAGVMYHHGFADPTAAQWATWGSLAALQSAFASGPCASSYFSISFDHCDAGDLASGYVWNSPLTDPAKAANEYSETFLVRAVPEPATYALMVAGLGALGLIARRRQRG